MITPKHISDALLIHTCHDICAVVCLSAKGEVLSVRLFDPLYFKPSKEFSEKTAQIWLIANHECGNTEPQNYEWQHLHSIVDSAMEREVRFFLSSEYWDCREICVARQTAM